MTELDRIIADQKIARDLIEKNPNDRGLLQWIEDLVMEEVIVRGIGK